jgi:hypothetical protein
MPQASPSRDQNKFIVRLPEGMRNRIAEAAKANGRSMNAEIVSALAERYPARSPLEEAVRRIARLLPSLRTESAIDVSDQVKELGENLMSCADQAEEIVRSQEAKKERRKSLPGQRKKPGLR